MDGVLVDFAGYFVNTINKNLKQDPNVAHSDSKSKSKTLKKIQDENLKQIDKKFFEEITKKRDSGGELTSLEKTVRTYWFSLLGNNEQAWVDMEILPGAKEMFNLAKQKGEVYILTAPVDATSESGKIKWVKNHFPDFPENRIIITSEKGQAFQNLYSSGEIPEGSNAYLIDDRTKFINQFNSAGGTGILHSENNVGNTINFLKNL